MMRKVIVVGDPPAPGGAVLPYGGHMSDVFGHRFALIGGRAYCEDCNSVGIIAKAGGPRRGCFHGAEMALEGDVVVCHCPVPPPLVSRQRYAPVYEDEMAGAADEFEAGFAALPGWFTGDAATVAASKKLVDGMVEHPPEAEQTENICPNITNREFCTLVMELRDQAVRLIKVRLKDLEKWGEPEQERVIKWFGVGDESIRQHLLSGLVACNRVLRGLSCNNFVRYSEQLMRNVGCLPSGNKLGLVAEVCKPDTRTHTIGIAFGFCSIPDAAFSTDSRLSTLIHEVTHFDDTFSSKDTVGTMRKSLPLASNPEEARFNADSITGYVLYVD